MHEMFQHRHKGIALAGRERLYDQSLGGVNRGRDVADQPAAQRREEKRFGAAVDGAVAAVDQLLLFQPSHHIADGRAVKRDDMAQRRLIQTWVIVDGEQSGILNRRDVELFGLLQEQREGNLLQPANEMAGHGEKAIVVG
jgi:hypothetical protein